MRGTRPGLETTIRDEAIRLGFDTVGIVALRESEHADFLRHWLARGRHGDMDWLARPDAVEARTDPQSRWPSLRSAIVVAMNYASREGDDSPDASRAIIARYARGRDYHRVMRKRLLALLRGVEEIAGRELPAARAYVDTGPVLERELAQRAGLGWFGRNTMLIHPRRGSYFFLGALLTELDLAEGDTAPVRDHCGTCNACVEACPTGALLGRDANGAPVIDATRCISYLTIEHRGSIPLELRPLIGNRVFGCDICQEVCPWNAPKFVPLTRDRAFQERTQAQAGGQAQAQRRERTTASSEPRTLPGTVSPPLIELMRVALDDEAWDAYTRGSAIRRAGRGGLARNVAVALGNWGSVDAVSVLASALEDAEPLIRGHAAWALGQIGSPNAFDALETRALTEDDPFVRSELEAALERARPPAK